MKIPAPPNIEALIPYPPGKPVEELERELGIGNIVKLASNENPLGPSPRALEAARKTLEGVNFYPDGHSYYLRERLADHLSVDSSWIVVGNGSNDVLDMCARAFLGPETSTVVSRHAFVVYELASQTMGARIINVPCKTGHGHNLPAMADAVERDTRIVWIANPNNPTGTMSTHRELFELLETVPESVLVVVDEAYLEYVEDPEYPDCMDLLMDHENLLIARTFSKIYGLAGLRVGYGIARPEVIGYLNRVRHPFNVSVPAQAAAMAALDDAEHVERSRANNREQMKAVTQGIEALGLSYIPSWGNFLTIHLGRPAGEVYQALLHKGVIARPVGNYGFPDSLRVTIGLPAENERFLEALAEVLRE